MQEIQVLLHDIHAKKMELSESFQVAAIIEKLPPMWRDFKNYLKHKCKEMNLEELIVRLRIEEDNRKNERKPIDQLGANFFETKQRPLNKKRKISNDAPRRDNSKMMKKFKGKCYNCEKVGHHSNEYRKHKKPAQANMIEKDNLSEGMQEMSLSAVVSECNMVGNTREWWVDTGATRHVCVDRAMFSNYQELKGEQLFKGNAASSKIEGSEIE